jgi:hypothetical protein
MSFTYHANFRVLLLFALTLMMTLFTTILTTMSLISPASSPDLLLLVRKDNSTRVATSTPASNMAMQMESRAIDYPVNAGDVSSSLSSSTSSSESNIGIGSLIHNQPQDFFDCTTNKSKCTFFYPGEFYRHYFNNALLLSSSNSDAIPMSNDDRNISNDEFISRIKEQLGLNNANLPALDSFSWRIKRSNDVRQGSSTNDADANDTIINTTIMKMMQSQYNLPIGNITYIHIHKCGGTSIQGALYRRARRIRNMAFHIVANFDDAQYLHPQRQRHPQMREEQNATTAFIELHADVHAYRHSFGGGSIRKKEMWDAERLDHIQAIRNSQSLAPHLSSVSQTLQRHQKQQQLLLSNDTTSQQHKQSTFHNQLLTQYHRTSPHVVFTIVRDPIQRFLSAIQQVMQYNVEFRQKCLFEDEEEEKTRRGTQPLSSFKLPSWSVLLKWRWQAHQEEKEHNDQEIKAQMQQLLRRQTIQCSIQDMLQTSYRKDVHLQPMASHFRLLEEIGDDADATTPTSSATPEQRGSKRGIAVSVFSMEDIHHVLTHLLGEYNRHSDSGGGENETSTIHMRDRSNKEYATSSILSQLSSSDCDEKMIRQICALYHVDVELMKWLGFGGEAVERC